MNGMHRTVFNSNIRDVEVQGISRRIPPERRWWRIPRRYVLALTCYAIFAIREWMILNIAMILYNRFKLEDEEAKVYFPQIAGWTVEETEGIVYSFHWANAIAQLPCALLNISFLPRRLMAAFMLLGCILHMMTPWALKNSASCIIVLIFLQGLFTAILDSSCISLWRTWAPPKETTSLIVLAFSGRNMSGILIYHLSENFGPYFIYYIVGISGIVWFFMWFALTSDSPMSDPFITDYELRYLDDEIPSRNYEKVSLRSIPAKRILMSLTVISLCFVFLTAAFSQRASSLYLYEVLDSGYNTWIYWFIYLDDLVGPLLGFLVVFLLNKKIVQTTNMRKILCCGGLILYAVFMSGNLVQDSLARLICFMLSSIFLTVIYVGALPNVLDLSPIYSCIIMGIVMTVSTFSEIAFDYIVPELESEHQKNHEWLISFIPSAVLSAVSALMFGIWGSGDEQPWSNREPGGHDAGCYPPTDTADQDNLVTESL